MTGQNGNGLIVDVKNVVKSFPVGDTEITILKGISFQVDKGEFLSIVGPSGNGKSTLLNMITGIDRPTDGEVTVLGHQVHEMSENALARWRGENVGIIFQFFQMLPALTLLNNIVLPMDLAKKYKPRERRERAMHLLEIVGLADQAHKLPSMVSGGQQQRAAISRALANDTASARMVFDLFNQLVAEGKTLLMVTHDKELAHQVPRKIEIMDGHITRDEYLGVGDWAGH
jgi:putative ABC transport system ATP-binding protein